MRQWRDVISLSGYQKAVMAKARRRFPLMNGNLSPQEDRLLTIGVELSLYHRLQKDLYLSLDARVRALRELSRLAFSHMNDLESNFILHAYLYKSIHQLTTG